VGSWWAGRIRQFGRHLFGRVTPAERRELGEWLTPSQLALFASMHRADRRHGLDVVRSLRALGHDDRDLLLAALFHDAGKGPSVGLWHRVGWALADRYGERVRSVIVRLPGFGGAFERIGQHPELSARLALAAGCSERTAQLIRGQALDADDDLGHALLLADEAN
jgi:hypothetical protein